MPSSYNLSAWTVLLMATLISASPTASPNPDLLGAVGSLIQGLPILSYPLPEMVTKDISPECASLNKGTRLCCQSTFDGDVPLVLELAPIVGYKLDPNSINGIYCSKDAVCAKGTDLCCQVDTFTKVIPDLLSLALYCQDTPKQPSSTPKPY